MFSKNLKYYRLKCLLSQKELAEKVNITPMAISNYEKGKREPDMEMLKRLANVLGVRVSDFLAVRNDKLQFSHNDFSKDSNLTVTQQEYIRESVEEYFNRFFTIVEILGGEVLSVAPDTNVLEVSGDNELNALSLRKHLNLAVDGPIDNLVDLLDRKGILVHICEVSNEKFFGVGGFVNERPYIVVNKNMRYERTRITLVHELCRLMFKWDDIKISKKQIDVISGAFLFPKTDAIRELGLRRTKIAKDMQIVAREYGISMYMLVKRARFFNIVSESLAKRFYNKTVEYSVNDKAEKASLFEQLVYRAASENEVSIQRAAELLHVSYDEIVLRTYNI